MDCPLCGNKLKPYKFNIKSPINKNCKYSTENST